MFEFKKRTLSIAAEKELEYLRAKADAADQNAADIAYVAMMSGIDPCTDGDGENEQVV